MKLLVSALTLQSLRFISIHKVRESWANWNQLCLEASRNEDADKPPPQDLEKQRMQRSDQDLLPWSRNRWGCELAGTLWWYWCTTEPEWGLPWVKKLLVAAVSGDFHTVLGFTSRSPTRFSPGRPKKRSLWPWQRKGRESLWRGQEPSLEQKLLSRWDCARAQSWRLSQPGGGIAPLQPFQPSSHWEERDIHPSGEARLEFTAQGSATKREISSYDCRPLSSPRHMTIGQWCNNHDYRRQSCRIQGLCGETHREAQVQEAPDKDRRRTWNFWHLGPQQTSPGVLPTQMDMEPPINGLFIPVPITQYNTSCGERAPPLSKVMRQEAWHTQRRDQVSGVSLEILEHLPPKPVCLLSALCFHLHLWLYGGLSPLPVSEKRVSLQLQLIIPGCDSVSTYKLLWKSSSLPE